MFDEKVLGCVPVKFNATGDALVEETEVNADVAGDGGLPSKVWVGKHAGGREVIVG